MVFTQVTYKRYIEKDYMYVMKYTINIFIAILVAILMSMNQTNSSFTNLKLGCLGVIFLTHHHSRFRSEGLESPLQGPTDQSVLNGWPNDGEMRWNSSCSHELPPWSPWYSQLSHQFRHQTNWNESRGSPQFFSIFLRIFSFQFPFPTRKTASKRAPGLTGNESLGLVSLLGPSPQQV